MSIKGKAYIAGVFEHPTRKADTQSLAQLHAESAKGALEDAGLTRADVDGYFCAGDAPGLGGLSMAERHEPQQSIRGDGGSRKHQGNAAEDIDSGKAKWQHHAGGAAGRGLATHAPATRAAAPECLEYRSTTVVTQYAMAASDTCTIGRPRPARVEQGGRLQHAQHIARAPRRRHRRGG